MRIAKVFAVKGIRLPVLGNKVSFQLRHLLVKPKADWFNSPIFPASLLMQWNIGSWKVRVSHGDRLQYGDLRPWWLQPKRGEERSQILMSKCVWMCLNATSSGALSHFHFKGFFQILTWHFGKLIHRNQHGPTTPKPSQQTATCLTDMAAWPPPVCKGSASKASRLNCPLASCWSNILVRESLWTSLSRL